VSTAPHSIKPRALFLDVYGPFVRPLGGWIAIADLVRLMDELGVDADIVRSTASRMTKDGLLERRPGPRHVQGYALSEKLHRALEIGDRRIFEAHRPARLSDGWLIVTFSIPETDRQLRHLLRSRLVWLGFGNLAPGVWVAPRRLLGDVRKVVASFGLERYVDIFSARFEGPGELQDVVRRAWELDELAAGYQRFLADHGPVLERWRRPPTAEDGCRAFVDYVMTLTRWRRLPFLDPGLPAELLPDGWPGHAASRAFIRLARALGPTAFEHVRLTMDVPDAGQRLARIHGG
jgi:phenylacetic acid degradation operon negative regulatory protein